jgi:hypothetical protein
MLLAYTFTFGNLSATLSLEDGLERRVNNTFVFPLFGVGAAGPAFGSRSPMAASACPMSSATCDTPALGAACSSPAHCTRSATWQPALPLSMA